MKRLSAIVLLSGVISCGSPDTRTGDELYETTKGLVLDRPCINYNLTKALFQQTIRIADRNEDILFRYNRVSDMGKRIEEARQEYRDLANVHVLSCDDSAGKIMDAVYRLNKEIERQQEELLR